MHLFDVIFEIMQAVVVKESLCHPQLMFWQDKVMTATHACHHRRPEEGWSLLARCATAQEVIYINLYIDLMGFIMISIT